MEPFLPLFANPHAATIAASLWPRRLDVRRFPVHTALHRTEPEVRVLVDSQYPAGAPRGHILMVHGLEGSSEAGYMRSFAQAALEAGYAAHRSNIRTCGGSEFLCRTLYHAGLTTDLRVLVRHFEETGQGPLFLVGFSLGGNMALKLAAELSEQGRVELAAVCVVSTPLDLEACARRIGEPQNRLYEWRFVSSMKQRLRQRQRLLPEIDFSGLDRIRSIFDLDDKITAPAFGFRGAVHYYSTQSAQNYLADIRIPTLFVQAKDDPLIPFSVFDQPALNRNGCLRLEAPEHGGHLGFLDTRARFWVNRVLLAWIQAVLA